MTWRPPGLTQEEIAKFKRMPQYRYSPDLISEGAYWGSNLDTLTKDAAVKDFLQKPLRLSETTQEDAHAIGSLNTFWVLDKKSPLVGIWGPNIVADHDVREAQRLGFPAVTGFFTKVGQIPDTESFSKRKTSLTMQDGFWDAWEAAYFKSAQLQDVKIKGRTRELSVEGGGVSIWFAKTDAESEAEDGPHPGVSLVKDGLWEQVTNDKQPSSFGIPGRLLAYDEDTGEIVVATEEYASILAAAQKGDAGAIAALKGVGLNPQGQVPQT